MPKRLNLGSKFLKEELLAMTHVNGEFYFATDTNELFFCDDDELKLINAGGATPAPVLIDLADLDRDGDQFILPVLELNGKLVHITNETLLEPVTPEAPFSIVFSNYIDEGQYFGPMTFNLFVEEINSGYGFVLTHQGYDGNAAIIKTEYENGVLVEEPTETYTNLNPQFAMKVEIVGATLFLTYAKALAI